MSLPWPIQGTSNHSSVQTLLSSLLEFFTLISLSPLMPSCHSLSSEKPSHVFLINNYPSVFWTQYQQQFLWGASLSLFIPQAGLWEIAPQLPTLVPVVLFTDLGPLRCSQDGDPQLWMGPGQHHCISAQCHLSNCMQE